MPATADLLFGIGSPIFILYQRRKILSKKGDICLLEQIFNVLTEKEKLVLCGYFALHMKWVEIAEELGISRQRVEQLKDSLLQKLELRNEVTQSLQGYLKIISLGPPPILAICEQNGNMIEKIKPYTRIKIVGEDKIVETWKEKRRKYYRTLKQKRELASKYAKFTIKR